MRFDPERGLEGNRGKVEIKDGAGYILYPNEHFPHLPEFRYEVMTIDGYRAVNVLKTRVDILVDEGRVNRHEAKVTLWEE